MLVRLWVEGPHTFGIFRQGTSVKKVKELKDSIDNSELMHGCGLLVVMVTDSLCVGVSVDISEVHIHVLGALLKVLCILKYSGSFICDSQDLLCNVPGGVLSCTRYTEFVASNDIPDPNTRAQHIKK